MAAQTLLINESMVQVPVVIVTFGEGGNAKTFGLYSKTTTSVIANQRLYNTTKVIYPNYVQSLKVKKINGTVNTYTLSMVYPITPSDDPNFMDKIFSSVSNSRKITFTYGDMTLPAFIYRDESALITNVERSMDLQNFKITYTITAVGSTVLSASGSYSFPGYTNKKPSDIIRDVLYNESYGLLDIFYGMKNKGLVGQMGLIPGDDKSCKIEKQTNITPLNYLSYLVSCMSSTVDVANSMNKTAIYVMSLCDDTYGVLNGPYFKITKVVTSLPKTSSIEYYAIDIGYPTDNFVLDFSISDNQAYSLLFDYSEDVVRSDYIYRIDDNGNTYQIYSPSISNNSENLKTTEADKTWWSSMTSYPVSGTLKFRGVCRSTLLMSYIRISTYIYGQKLASASGVFIITEETDTISSSGCETQLSVTRIEGDDDQVF